MRTNLATIAIYVVGVGVLLVSGFVVQARAFNDTDLLTRQIKATTIKRESIDRVLGRLAVDYQVPIGIELGNENLTPLRQIDLDLPVTNVKGFLDALIVKDPRYTWTLEGGVIHLWPVTARDSFVTTLLNTKISHFAVTGGSSIPGVYHDIMNLPEIGSRLVVADVAPMVLAHWGGIPKLDKDTFFSESNLTLKELLDRIISKTEIKTWVILRWGTNNEYITLRT